MTVTRLRTPLLLPSWNVAVRIAPARTLTPVRCSTTPAGGATGGLVELEDATGNLRLNLCRTSPTAPGRVAKLPLVSRSGPGAPPGGVGAVGSTQSVRSSDTPKSGRSDTLSSR